LLFHIFYLSFIKEYSIIDNISINNPIFNHEKRLSANMNNIVVINIEINSDCRKDLLLEAISNFFLSKKDNIIKVELRATKKE